MITHALRIARASTLARDHPASAPLLKFYAELARFQEKAFAELQSKGETDVRAVVLHFPALIQLVSRSGTEMLANFAADYLQGTESQLDLLSAVWEGGAALAACDPAGRFYARVLLQPFAEYLASRGPVDASGQASGAGATCPFCNARPVAGVLRREGDGAERRLLCSLCSTEWPFLRVLCPGCGEENKDKLPIYRAAEFPAARIDACDTCQTYLKSIDLTKDGHAIPMVDEIASVALNVWADEQGYVKLETNLLGM